MTIETVLTDVEIGVCICRVYDKSNAREIGELRLSSHIVPIGRAIEQAVLQSDEVKGLREDAERLNWVIEQECQIQTIIFDNSVKYRVGWPDDGEFQSEWFANPRAAIDAAMENTWPR